MTTALSITTQRLVEDITQKYDTAHLLSDVQAPVGMSNEQASEFFEETEAVVNYHTAFALASAFEYRKKEAKAKLEELGIISDADKELEPSDKPYTVQSNDAVSLQLKVSKPATRVDSKKLVTELRKAGVDPELLDKALETATSTNAPAKSYTATII